MPGVLNVTVLQGERCEDRSLISDVVVYCEINLNDRQCVGSGGSCSGSGGRLAQSRPGAHGSR